MEVSCPLNVVRFLSTPSARRATHFLCGVLLFKYQISIHALREEGDAGMEEQAARDLVFLSTPSARRATVSRCIFVLPPGYFYPRPPRGGRLDRIHRGLNNMAFLSTPSARRATRLTGASPSSDMDFYPRPPRGGRPAAVRPCRLFFRHFYPRPPRGGRRCRPCCSNRPDTHFYPRPPRGGRPGIPQTIGNATYISIHALREEGDDSSPH